MQSIGRRSLVNFDTFKQSKTGTFLPTIFVEIFLFLLYFQVSIMKTDDDDEDVPTKTFFYFVSSVIFCSCHLTRNNFRVPRLGMPLA